MMIISEFSLIIIITVNFHRSYNNHDEFSFIIMILRVFIYYNIYFS